MLNYEYTTNTPKNPRYMLFTPQNEKNILHRQNLLTEKNKRIRQLHLGTSPTLSSITCLVSKSTKIWSYVRQERLPWKEVDKNQNRNNHNRAYTCYISIYQLWQQPNKTAILLQAFCHTHCNCIHKQEQKTLVCLLTANKSHRKHFTPSRRFSELTAGYTTASYRKAVMGVWAN